MIITVVNRELRLAERGVRCNASAVEWAVRVQPSLCASCCCCIDSFHSHIFLVELCNCPRFEITQLHQRCHLPRIFSLTTRLQQLQASVL